MILKIKLDTVSSWELLIKTNLSEDQVKYIMEEGNFYIKIFDPIIKLKNINMDIGETLDFKLHSELENLNIEKV